MKFEEALSLLKAGHAVKRKNDDNHVRVFLVKGSIDLEVSVIADYKEKSTDNTSYIPLILFEPGDEGTITRLPRLDAITGDGNTVTGWTPTAIDLLANDWFPAAAEADDLAAA